MSDDWFESFCISELDMTPEEAVEMVLREYQEWAADRSARFRCPGCGAAMRTATTAICPRCGRDCTALFV